METLKTINKVKKAVLKKLTNPLKNSNNLDQLKTIPKEAQIKILITRPNHRLGNQLLITPLVQEIEKEFPNCKIDLVFNGNLSDQLFSNYDCVDNIIQFPKKPFQNLGTYISQVFEIFKKKYYIVIAGNETSSSSKIFAKLARGKFTIINSENCDNTDKPIHIAKYPVYNFKKALNNNQDLTHYNYSRISIKLTDEEIEKGAKILHNIFDNDKSVICIFTFATGKKCYSKAEWRKFYKDLKIKFPESNILEMLPYENISKINFKSKNFYSTDLREIAAVIENANIFIGADSGIMHLAASTNTATLGLFKTTSIDMYEPYGGENFSINTNDKNIEEILDLISKTSSLQNTKL